LHHSKIFHPLIYKSNCCFNKRKREEFSQLIHQGNKKTCLIKKNNLTKSQVDNYFGSQRLQMQRIIFCIKYMLNKSNMQNNRNCLKSKREFTINHYHLISVCSLTLIKLITEIIWKYSTSIQRRNWITNR
jgi:hypothetical protein